MPCAIEFVALDFETTGHVQHQEELPWQIGLLCMRDGEPAAESGKSMYLRVPAEHHFNQYAPGRWAEIRDELALAPSMQEAWPELAPWLTGHYLVAHNAPVERGILQRAFPMHRFGPWLDTLRLSRRIYPGLPSYALSDLLETLGLRERVQSLCPGLEPHNAFYDAVACGCLLHHLISLPVLAGYGLEELAR